MHSFRARPKNELTPKQRAIATASPLYGLLIFVALLELVLFLKPTMRETMSLLLGLTLLLLPALATWTVQESDGRTQILHVLNLLLISVQVITRYLSSSRARA